MARMNQAMTDLYKYNSALINKQRSRFDKSHSHTTTFDSSYLIPLMWDRVLPGDEKEIHYSGLARMATPIHPVMDEAKFDVWCFYVPDRLWWNHARQFYGENLDADFNPDGEYRMPSLSVSRWRVKSDGDHLDNGIGSLNDYFGFPVISDSILSNMVSDNYSTDVSKIEATAGLHRCYQLIWNEWFRNSSVQPALTLNTGDVVSEEEWSVIREKRRVNKFPDYFTTLLKEPLAGNDVSLPLSEWIPVVPRSADVDDQYYEKLYPSGKIPGVSIRDSDNESSSGDGTYKNLIDNEGILGVGSKNSGASGTNYHFGNLWARFTSSDIATINNLRSAITIQQLLETDNRAGKRYQQILQAHFGVLTPDATLQRPELLGCTRTDIGMRQVIQTSETSGDSPLGNVAAFSLTNVNDSLICNKSFTEPGFIIVLGAVRPVLSYSQGLDCLLTKLDRFDHFWPVFDNIGNQPVYYYELLCNSTTQDMNALDDVFGYKEAWLEYRTKQNRVSGLMRPDIPETLSSWNYSEYFNSSDMLALDPEFVTSDPNLIDRVIAVPSQPQFICDSYFQYYDTKGMAVHSTPGLTRL